MDKSWMNFNRSSVTYKKGVIKFLDFAFSNGNIEGKILCPCKNCGNGICVNREEAHAHLLWTGFVEGYSQWVAHGETSSYTFNHIESEKNSQLNGNMDAQNGMEGLLNDVFGFEEDAHRGVEGEIPNPEAENFYKLIEDSQQPLYSGCTNASKLSFIIELLHLKCLGNWSNKSFTMLLDLLRKVLPDGVQLPKSWYESRKYIKDLGLSYEKYDACRNDCMIYWGPDQSKTVCEACKMSRWVTPENDNDAHVEDGKEIKKVPAKMFWHFPLIPRLQRLFMSSKTADLMRWHKEMRTKDGNMRHPADSPAWKTYLVKS